MYIALDLTGSGKVYATDRPLTLEEKEEEEKEKPEPSRQAARLPTGGSEIRLRRVKSRFAR